MKGMKLALIILLALPLVSAVSGVSALSDALGSLCSGLTSMLPVAAMLMTVLAAVIYAAGQMMGAETRARANTWATAALTGAMMAILISTVSPSVMSAVYGGSISCTGTSSSVSSCLNGNGAVACTYDSSTQKCCCSGTAAASCVAKASACGACPQDA